MVSNFGDHACRSRNAIEHLKKAQQIHCKLHCMRCCHHRIMPLHDNSSSLRHDHSCGCRTSNQRMGALSFLQPLCSGQSATERHWPYQWSLMMRAFASWKACMQHPQQVYIAALCQVGLALAVCLLLDGYLNACTAVHELHYAEQSTSSSLNTYT